MAATAEAPGFIVQIVQFESNKTRAEVLAAADERKPMFEAMDGLVQRYYLELEAPNHYGGVYIWKDKASMAAFLQSDLFRGISAAYGIASKPQVQIASGLSPLR
jgi:heme-degrading monooxygenase HmoA